MPSTSAWVVDGRAFVSTYACPSTLGRLAAVLSPDERTRLQGFQRLQRAGEFLLGRLLMRYALMQVSGCSLADIDVTERRGASPAVRIAGALADGIAQPATSISHSRGWIACAIATGTQIGVDIEAPSPERDLDSLADLAFTPEELSGLAQHDDSQREAAFYRLWCAKEADYKYRHNARHNQASAAADAVSFLHHEEEPHYHLCVCTGAQAQQHRTHDIALEVLLAMAGNNTTQIQ